MANATDAEARSIHGTNPQNLVEKITRSKIYGSLYWKEQCFALTAETVVDRAIELDHFGGTFGGNNKATRFLCLTLKLLQIQPEKEIIVAYILNNDYKYLRLLGAFYMRLTGRPVDVYTYLEPLLNDCRRVRSKLKDGKFALSHVDEFVDTLLRSDCACDITMPHLPRRWVLESTGDLAPRKSALEEAAKEAELDDMLTTAAAAAAKAQAELEDAKRAAAAADREKADARGGGPARHSRGDGEREDRGEARRERDRHRDRPHSGRERDSDSRRRSTSHSRGRGAEEGEVVGARDDGGHRGATRRRRESRSRSRERRDRRDRRSRSRDRAARKRAPSPSSGGGSSSSDDSRGDKGARTRGPPPPPPPPPVK